MRVFFFISRNFLLLFFFCLSEESSQNLLLDLTGKHILLFGVGSQHLKKKKDFILLQVKSFFPCLHFHNGKSLIKIIFGRKMFVCQPISQIFVALFKNFWDDKG